MLYGSNYDVIFFIQVTLMIYIPGLGYASIPSHQHHPVKQPSALLHSYIDNFKLSNVARWCKMTNITNIAKEKATPGTQFAINSPTRPCVLPSLPNFVLFLPCLFIFTFFKRGSKLSSLKYYHSDSILFRIKLSSTSRVLAPDAASARGEHYPSHSQ